MFREKIKVFDCTIRDGGLINDHRFTHDLVRKVYQALAKSGVDYMEVGYRNSRSILGSDFGPWKFCDEEDLQRVTEGVTTSMKLSVMADIGRVEKDDILPKSESIIDVIRVATYVPDIDKAIDLVNHCIDKGYETTVNIMAVSQVLERDLEEALIQLEAESPVPVVYIVDSFGSLYSEQIQFLYRKYHGLMPSKELGIHAHNNMQLAFANTIEAIILGANILDGTIYGIGRGAGNCPLELLLAFLKNPKFDIRPILDVIAKEFLPLREEMEWGYLVPYMLTGVLNEHPRAGIKMLASEEREAYVKFYEGLQKDLD